MNPGKPQSNIGLKEIGYFRVTDRLSESLPTDILKKINEALGKIPKGSPTVVIGSGLRQELSRYINRLHPDDTEVINIDPTLAITTPNNQNDTEGWEITVKEEKSTPQSRLKQVSYFYRQNVGSKGSTDKIYERRRKLLNPHAQSIATLAPSLPFAPNSIGLYIDLWGPGLYLNNQDIIKYTQNIARTLKWGGGTVIIYPIDYYGDAILDTEIIQQKALNRIQLIKDNLNTDGLKIEIFTTKDPGANRNRHGIIIKRSA